MIRRPHITDHALLRYLERVVGIDVDAHRAAIEVKTADAMQRGASALISGGHRYVLADGCVITVKPTSTPMPRPEREAEE